MLDLPVSDKLLAVLRKRPTILELAAKFALTKREYSELFDGHDPGDEDKRARHYARWVCSVDRRRPCDLDPNHFGPHEWQMRPRADVAPETTRDGLLVRAYGVARPVDERSVEAARRDPGARHES